MAGHLFIFYCYPYPQSQFEKPDKCDLLVERHELWIRNIWVQIQALALCAWSLSCVQLFVMPWTVICQTPLSMEFSRQEYWTGLPCPPPEDLPNPGIKPRSPILQADSLPSEPPAKPKNTGVGSLSLPQGIILTQELNQVFLHCRQILSLEALRPIPGC